MDLEPLLLRDRISETIKFLFEGRSVTEVSGAGFKAKFSASEQVSHVPEGSNENAAFKSSNSNDVTELIKLQKKNETKFSNYLLQQMKVYIDSLNITPEKRIEVLESELSLLQARLCFIDLNRVLFRSQFDLLVLIKEKREIFSISDMTAYFAEVKTIHPNVYSGTDLYGYLAYPMLVNLIVKDDDKYTLTTYGESYVDFMGINIQFISELKAN